jgi:RNA recognition motif-containing protein
MCVAIDCDYNSWMSLFGLMTLFLQRTQGSIVECKHTSDQSPSSSADDKGQKGAVQVDTDRAQRTVFVGGLLKTTSSIGLRKALSAFGGIEDAFIVKDKVSGRSRGFGFATFVKVEAAQRAVETMTFDVDVRFYRSCRMPHVD